MHGNVLLKWIDFARDSNRNLMREMHITSNLTLTAQTARRLDELNEKNNTGKCRRGCVCISNSKEFLLAAIGDADGSARIPIRCDANDNDDAAAE